METLGRKTPGPLVGDPTPLMRKSATTGEKSWEIKSVGTPCVSFHAWTLNAHIGTGGPKPARLASVMACHSSLEVRSNAVVFPR